MSLESKFLPFRWDGRYVRFVVPEVEGHSMVVVKRKEE